jgi:hypothetical protein
MTNDEKIEFSKIPQEHLIMFHHSMGQHIRNRFYLWDEKNPFSKPNALPNAEGIVDDPFHPDQISHRILTVLRLKCLNRTQHEVILMSEDKDSNDKEVPS